MYPRVREVPVHFAKIDRGVIVSAEALAERYNKLGLTLADVAVLDRARLRSQPQQPPAQPPQV